MQRRAMQNAGVSAPAPDQRAHTEAAAAPVAWVILDHREEDVALLGLGLEDQLERARQQRRMLRVDIFDALCTKRQCNGPWAARRAVADSAGHGWNM